MKKELNTVLSTEIEYAKVIGVALIVLAVFFVYSADITYGTKNIDEDEIFVNSQTLNLIK